MIPFDLPIILFFEHLIKVNQHYIIELILVTKSVNLFKWRILRQAQNQVVKKYNSSYLPHFQGTGKQIDNCATASKAA